VGSLSTARREVRRTAASVAKGRAEALVPETVDRRP
jgi:hypothetical protein